MSAVSLLSSLREKPSDDSSQDGPKEEGDEECPPSGGGGGGDPAVLAMGPARRPLQYTRDELMALRNSPLAKRALDNAEPLALVLKKRPDSPNDDDRGARGDAPNENHKGVYGRDRERRSADPRERVRKESEPTGGGIVLSPQRRSFTSGCGAPGAAAPPPPLGRTRPESPLSPAAAAGPLQKPDHAGGGRRIGSGRIMVRDVSSAPWERAPPEEPEPREPYRAPAQPYRAEERAQRPNNERYERRSYGRDSFTSDMKREREDRFNNEKRERDDNRRAGGRYRRYDKDEEPEWFSGGPTSQNDTIELRGFDEPAKRNGNANAKETEKWNNKESGSRSPPQSRRPAAVASPQPNSNDNDASDNSNDKDSGVESKAVEQQAAGGDEQPDFNLDEFLQFDNIPDVLTNGGGESEGSRFSRWFRRESPTNEHNRHFERRLHSMVDDLDSSSHAPPPTSAAEQQRVFAPISPALAPNARPPSLLELLRRANVDERAPDMNNVGGKMHSLEELEARLRPQHAAQDHDLSAFKRLLAQVSGGHAVPAAEQQQRPPQPQPQPQPQPMSLLQMLNKSMEQQQAQQQAQQQQQQAPPHIPQQLLYKLLQVQRQQQQAPPPPPQPEPRANSTDRELLQRPEAQAIIHGLKAGEITVQHLMQQLSNPGLQSRHRELLLTILRIHQQHRQMGGSPLPTGVGAPPAPHLVVPPHHQPLRLSPLPHPGVPGRIPSPRELAAHTQSIMQGALIKKKLEEQRENYRRRTELQPKQPTPISFTPTSVLRKMTAEKESDAPSPKQQQQWSQPPKMPQGRPIVKGNQSGAAPQMGYTPTAAEYQQHYLSQQQQMANAIRPFPHPQQRQMPQSQMNNMSNLTRGVASGTTLHQLLVQSHQRTLNEMGGGAVGAGGGDNQLARWFSPELLARASAGKLPSLRVPNALSLEELERAHHSPAVRN